MKTRILVTVEVREVRDVRRHRHLSHEHREKIGQSLRERYEEAKRLQRLASGRCFVGKPNCNCHYCLRAAKASDRHNQPEDRVEAFALIREHATAIQELFAKTGLGFILVDRNSITLG